MKLRIRGNSIRFRLGETEVQAIASGEILSEHVQFGPRDELQLRYEILATEDTESIRARYLPGRITVNVPLSQVQAWAQSTEEGLYAEQPVTASSVLKIALEKDYRCLVPRAEEEDAGAFRHPREGKAEC